MTTETQDPASSDQQIRAVVEREGGAAHLLEQCEQVSAHHGDRYQPFVWRYYTSHRKALFRVIKTLEFHSTTSDQALIEAMTFIIAHEQDPKKYLEATIDLSSFASKKWLRTVMVRRKRKSWFIRQHLETCVFSYVAAELKTGDLCVAGSEQFADYRDTHWQDLLRVVISIQEGKVLPSMLLRKLTTYSHKNRLYQAFHALGSVERTIFLLTFISDVKLREVIHRSTNKVEEYHNFEDWITFALRGVITDNVYEEIEGSALV